MPPRRVRRPPLAPDVDRPAADRLIVAENADFSQYEVDEDLTDLMHANLPAGVQYSSRRVALLRTK